MAVSSSPLKVTVSLPSNPEGEDMSLPTKFQIRESETTATQQPRKFWLWDDTDNKFPPHRMLFLILSFLLYLIDVGLDIWVAIEYYIADRRGTDEYARHYLAATLFFIVVPCLVVNFISWALYTWGWMIYRNRKLKNYCCERLEPMKYIRHDKERNEISTVLVDGVHVIRWQKKPTAVQTTRQISALYRSKSLPNSPNKKADLSPILSDTDLNITETDSGLEFYPLDLFDTSEYIVLTIIHILLGGYLFRIVRLIYTRGRDKYSFDRYRDISFLRLIESFMESAPQTVLQLYLLVVHQEAVLWYKIVTPISIIFSVISLALAVGDYISAAKDVNHYDPHPNNEKKPRLSWAGYFAIIFWHLCMIVARSLAFSLFATLYGAYVFIFVGLHYLAMVYWMFWQHAHVFKRRPEDFDDKMGCIPARHQVSSWRKCLCPCDQLCANYGIEFLVAVFNVFFHFKVRDGRAIVTLIPFYLLSFIENSIMILLWYFGRDFEMMAWYPVPALVTVFVAFTVGLVLLSIYYLWCQPSKMKSLELDHTLEHPTMTSSLNRMYEFKQRRGNFFRRTFSCNAKE